MGTCVLCMWFADYWYKSIWVSRGVLLKNNHLCLKKESPLRGNTVFVFVLRVSVVVICYCSLHPQAYYIIYIFNDDKRLLHRENRGDISLQMVCQVFLLFCAMLRKTVCQMIFTKMPFSTRISVATERWVSWKITCFTKKSCNIAETRSDSWKSFIFNKKCFKICVIQKTCYTLWA